MKKKMIVSFVNWYDFLNDDGQKVQGANAWCLTDKVETNNEKGRKIAKFKIDYTDLVKLKTLPCIIEGDLDFTSDKDNKPILLLRDIKYIDEYKIEL